MTSPLRWTVWGTMVLLAGCSSRPGPVAEIEKVVPVEGTLTFQGKPLAGYQVTLIPVDGRRPATGVTDASGKFVLGTNRAGDGAPPGKHKVTVVWAGPSSAGEPGQESVIDNPAKLPKPAVRIPAKYAHADSSGLTQDIPPGGLKDLKIDLK